MGTLFSRMFWFTALLVALCDIVVATFLGGYNTYTDDFDFGRGFEVIGDVFGDMLGMFFVLLVVGAICAGIGGLVQLWKKGKQGIVLIVSISMAVILPQITFGWIGLSWGMFASLPMLLFVLFQTWVITLVYRRALKKAADKIHQLSQSQTV